MIRDLLTGNWFNLYPFYKGRGRLAQLCASGKSPDEIVCTTLLSGEKLFVYPVDFIGQMSLLFGDLDETLSKFCLDNIGPGDVVLDVGANCGLISIPCANRVGETGRVISFEPNPGVSALLERSAELNGLSNISLYPYALSDKGGMSFLDVPKFALGSAKLCDSGEMACETHCLDKLPLGDIERVRLMKIDVEGFESEVLEGGKEFIARTQVDIVLFESLPSEVVFNERPEVVFLREAGYQILELCWRPYGRRKIIEIKQGDMSSSHCCPINSVNKEA